MKGMSWNAHVEKHSQAYGLVVLFEEPAVYKATTTKNGKKSTKRIRFKPGLDNNGKQVPTPYKALCEALEKTYKSDWASRSRSEAGHTIGTFRITGGVDAQALISSLNAQEGRTIPGCKATFRCTYHVTQYQNVLAKLGYVPRKS